MWHPEAGKLPGMLRKRHTIGFSDCLGVECSECVLREQGKRLCTEASIKQYMRQVIKGLGENSLGEHNAKSKTQNGRSHCKNT